MAKHGAKEHGPILSPMEEIPGNPKDLHGDFGSHHDGLDGYPKGTGGKIPEVTLDNEDGFGKIKEDGK